MTHSKEENKVAEISLEETQLSHLIDKDFKINVLNMLKELRYNTDKELKETRKTIYEQDGNINKEVGIIKWNQIENMKPKI